MEAWWKPVMSLPDHDAIRLDRENPEIVARNHDQVMIDQPLPTLAMQKIEGSSPFSRSLESPANGGVLLRYDSGRGGPADSVP
jgi:hypothetical protein